MRVTLDAEEAEDRLAELGLPTRRELLEAVEAGELSRVACSPFHPSSFPGTSAWANTEERLALTLVPQGWRFEDKGNAPLVVEPVLKLQIRVQSGSILTGNLDPEACPTTKHPKGPLLVGQVEVNQQQLHLFEERRFVASPHESERITWLLLIHSAFHPRTDTTGEHVAKCEISLPAAINEDGWVTRWRERIVLGEIRLDDIPAPNVSSDDHYNEEEIDVPVRRR